MFRLTNTGNSPAFLILRLALGSVMIMHGFQQTFGWFGDKGLNGKLAYYSDSFQIPWLVGFIGIMAISVGSIFLFLGLYSRIFAALDAVFLTVACLKVHIHNGFFMNWEGLKSGEGFEYHILGIGIALAIVIYGSGWLSIDRYLYNRRTKHPF